MIPVTLIPRPKLTLKKRNDGTLDVAFQMRPTLNLKWSKTVSIEVNSDTEFNTDLVILYQTALL
jgi:hypothetical protein